MSLLSDPTSNFLIGGDFSTNPWQRGTSFVSPASEDYLADRWKIRKVGVQEFTVTKDNSGPSESESEMTATRSMKFDVTTANAAPGVGDFTAFEQPIEGSSARFLYDTQTMLNFWVYSSVAGTYCMSFQNNARNKSYVLEYTISAPNTWEFIEVEYVHENTGTWETGNLTGIRAIFALNSGSTFQTAAGSWQSGDFYATSNQVNLTALNTNEFRVTNIRMSSGYKFDLFIPRTVAEDLSLCQRYFSKSYNLADAPGAITSAGVSTGKTGVVSEVRELQRQLPIAMRANPTIVWYNPLTGAANSIRDEGGAGTNEAVIVQHNESENSTGWPETAANTTEPEAQWVADAEL